MNRALDVAIAGTGLVVSSPLLAAGALAVKLEDGGPVLYRQTRVGRDGIDFELLKLRTMIVGAEKQGAGFAVDKGDARITQAGRLLRRLSLDELPQLWNVVRGDMSVIGPRPTLRYQVDHYDERQLHRLDVKPGITGWAQIHGRASLPWAERIELDLWYVRHHDWKTDLLILLRTPLALFGGTYRGRAAAGRRREADGAFRRPRYPPSRDGRPVHVRRAARRHRHRVPRAPARRRSPPTSTSSRPRSTTPTAGRSCRASTTSATSPRSATSSTLHDVRLIVPLTDLDHHRARRGARRAGRRAGARPGRRDGRALLRQVPRARQFFEEQGIGSPPTWLPDGAARRAPVPGAREGAQGLRLAPHLPRRRTRPSSTSSSATRRPTRWCRRCASATEFSIDVFCDLDGRCLAAVPANDDRVEGRRIDQGDDDQGSGADRVRLPRVRGAAHHRPGQRAVLPRARRRARR